jgi:hypothetical protein
LRVALSANLGKRTRDGEDIIDVHGTTPMRRFSVPPIEIRETIVTPGDEFDVVQIHISDVAPDAEGAAFRLVLLGRAPHYEFPHLAHLQKVAMTAARDVLNKRLERLESEMNRAGQPTEPR